MPRRKRQPEPEKVEAARKIHEARAALGVLLFQLDHGSERVGKLAFIGDKLLAILEELRQA